MDVETAITKPVNSSPSNDAPKDAHEELFSLSPLSPLRPDIAASDTTKLKAPASPPTPSKSLPSHSRTTTNTHRLLYRGALSLPDSHLLLDGLSFTIETSPSLPVSTSASSIPPSTSTTSVDSLTQPGKSKANDLLENPLALALESMRGRPSLHLLGTESLKDVWLDTGNEVHVYIHDYSVITKIYFENVLTLAPITSQDGRTSEGIRVSLSDSTDIGENDFLIYGQLRPDFSSDTEASSSTKPPQLLHILAARILPHPPITVSSSSSSQLATSGSTGRIPRPDDPTPRKPPAHLSSGMKRKREPTLTALDFSTSASNASKSNAKRAKSSSSLAGEVEEAEEVKFAREVMTKMPGPGTSFSLPPPKVLGREARIGKKEREFKVPELPRTQSLGGMDGDVFVESPVVGSNLEYNSSSSKGKGKGKAGEKEREREKEKVKPGSDELEKANKTVSVFSLLVQQVLTRHALL
ncbi:hypothetical protein K474DRAFT_1112134 [Panus rudis PR-1116 ss-1]|nr:hypothetical protein K474DRAFT_1112134 [Panus rudis PR-1116 ss-1]